MDEHTVSKLTAVINTLNLISVCGKQNLMRLSGCIDVLEEIAGELNKKEPGTGEVK